MISMVIFNGLEKRSQFVMPVPDQVRDDGSGIQTCSNLKMNWIPGQARNDQKGSFINQPARKESIREGQTCYLSDPFDRHLQV